MIPEQPVTPREEIEAKLTALLLGELPAEQAFALGRAIEKDLELKTLYERLKQTVQIVGEASSAITEPTASQPVKLTLSEGRRQQLLQHFKTVRPAAFVQKPRREFSLLRVAAMVAVICMLTVVIVPSLSKAKHGARYAFDFFSSGGNESLQTASVAAPPERGVARKLTESRERFSLASEQETLGRNAQKAESIVSLASQQTGSAPLALPIGDQTSARGYGFSRAASSAAPGPGYAKFIGNDKKLPEQALVARVAGGEKDRVDSYKVVQSPPLGTIVLPSTGLPGLTAETAHELPQLASDAQVDNMFLYKAQSEPKQDMFAAGGKDSDKEQLSDLGKAATPANGLEFGTWALADNGVQQSLPLQFHDDLAEQKPGEPAGSGATGAGFVTSNSLVVWTDSQHQKQGNVGLADGSVQQLNRSRLQDSLRNTSDSLHSGGPIGSADGQNRLQLQDHSQGITNNPEYDSHTYYRALAQNVEPQSNAHLVLPSNETPGDEAAFRRRYTKELPQKDINRAKSAGNGARDSREVPVAPSGEAKGKLEDLKRRPEQLSELAQNTAKNIGEARQKVQKAEEEANRQREILKKEQLTETLDLPVAKPAVATLIPQPEVQTLENSFSTFSLNVSDVSFKLSAASLEKGTMPEPATIRSEEFINAFDYRDPEPAPGVPVGFTWERAQYPFAQNRDLLRFSIKTAAQGRQPGKALNLVLLLDNSGSMERADRVQIIHEALKVLASQLQAQDTLSVVAFARTARLIADGVPGTQAGKVAEEAGKLTPEGGTNLEEAMNLAYQTAHRHFQANGVNRVVLLTDGAANLGNVEPTSLKSQVETQRQQGIALDCFGIGWDGYNDDLLEVLSRNGDGRYGFINAPDEAATGFAGQLAGALQVAASDVKVQVEFNPKRATAFRQIGYAKHQLTKEQFRDNTVDAAEIGAAESGNALYLLEVNPGGEGPLAIVRVRYKLPGTAEYREHEWTVPYNGHAPALEQSTAAMRLAATASAFSEWLISSPNSAEISPDRLLGYICGVPETYGSDPQPGRLEWMIRQAKSLTGK